MSDVVIVEHGSVTEIRLNRVAARNALSTGLAERLAAEAAAVGESGARAVVLSSAAPGAFCVGADLKERDGLDDAGFLAQRVVFRRLFASILHLCVPVVAAVHGYALGGGYELALSCDLIVADETAVVGLPEVRVGIVPGGGGTQLLPRRVGQGIATDLILTGRHVRAAEAERLRLVDRVVPAGSATSAALELAAQIAGNSPVAVTNARTAIRRGLDVDLSSGLEIEDAAWRSAVLSNDRREGVRAFVERRPPVWPT
ncbi:enoyl-CoA hydratase/isomerase family protein [Actinoplanes sp. L3-i22]|uniref:enoyl-CoA hydratase/isomerase family protein n=1 Tax=Actinoplanes sp. L3-i22 TaxID=2836373 RepID=UPI001C761130|nr:enoyl-CoA hydratase-related protein [Actinoplanes sp. L3-i22]BCY08477.1 enoyl-CoA hydratase [Actinoplanes sp. L3-i22]